MILAAVEELLLIATIVVVAVVGRGNKVLVAVGSKSRRGRLEVRRCPSVMRVVPSLLLQGVVVVVVDCRRQRRRGGRGTFLLCL